MSDRSGGPRRAVRRARPRACRRSCAPRPPTPAGRSRRESPSSAGSGWPGTRRPGIGAHPLADQRVVTERFDDRVRVGVEVEEGSRGALRLARGDRARRPPPVTSTDRRAAGRAAGCGDRRRRRTSSTPGRARSPRKRSSASASIGARCSSSISMSLKRRPVAFRELAFPPGPKRERLDRMRQLTSLDAQFLALETARQSGHVGGLAILDPSTAPGGKLELADVQRAARRAAAAAAAAALAARRGAVRARLPVLGRRPRLRPRLPRPRAGAAVAGHRREARRAGGADHRRGRSTARGRCGSST